MAINTGVNISKAVSFAVVSLNKGVDVSKAVAFGVISSKFGVSVSKAVAFSVIGSPVRNLTDSVSFSDSLTSAVAFSRGTSDTGSFSENIVMAFAGSRTTSDSVSFGENLLSSTLRSRSLADSLSASDVVAANVTPAAPFVVPDWVLSLPFDILCDYTANQSSNLLNQQPFLDALSQLIISLRDNSGRHNNEYLFPVIATSIYADWTNRINLQMQNRPTFAALMRRNGYTG